MLGAGLTILSVKNTTVARGDFVLCDGVSFSLSAGEICHLVGQNGLGKTTLLMQIMGILPTLDGDISYQNKPNAGGAVYVSHQTGIHESLTVAQNLTFLLSLYGIRPNASQLALALGAVGLAGFDEVKANELSAGQSRRVGLARLWLLTPEIAPLWVLDEPLTALDVTMVATLSNRLVEFANQGGAVLMTSHQALDFATKTVDLANFINGKQDDE